jgi:IS30 family transposase
MTRQTYHLTATDRAHIRRLYREGLGINRVAERTRVSRFTVSRVVQDIKRQKSGYRDGICLSDSAGWNPVLDQLERIALLDRAKQADAAAMQRLRGMGLTRWERADCGVILEAR